MGEISMTKLLVIAVLVILLFGTKKLASLGSDLGAALKGFKKTMNEDIPNIDADFLSDKKSANRTDK
ncbi:TPA: twin-arginine translocase TatA/TatE family subunit [Kluyvera cryocrescens]|uniref:twin-arginine translocase TatA/TatE family subunit n=1 Tax=Kluyvera cryocrescens TaxID=580 RepID=UPI000DA0A925|nr:twin-arginine translocase TatA/TatE family subunit [Kluyvera cryocrescens]NCB61571.1 twin-arginine translocase TatA/TatE family subunit [Gammaproteobacteria bacterium]MCX2865890.1 twin-arginine translocase TatA/TatE family subunit [Kluyvera cryocrescens]MDU5686887.1 twin-arginine translocase TatA/TatE family subunit [Kluyvera cryocrescens]MEB6632042.1 twin-arginine translocase TatA/TatE family subunit [Kluyvera cryocrescens]MEB7555778.1 twin-arginine translocase TatA/TatE family subunit [Kl